MSRLKALWDRVRKSEVGQAIGRVLMVIACRKVKEKTGVDVCNTKRGD